MKTLRDCPLCGSNNFNIYGRFKDYLISKEEFSVVKCPECGFLFTNPRPEIEFLGDYYQSDEYISHTDSRESVFDHIYHWVRKFMIKRKLSFIDSHLKNNVKRRILMDYGCGTGEFLMQARKSGYEVYGIEPNMDARDRAISKGIIVEKGLGIRQNNNIDFQVITLWHVLEHIPEPKKIIHELAEILEKDGLIVVAVPEYLSYDSKYYKEQWVAWDVPRHLNHFNKDTLCNIFYAYGFRLEKIYPLIFDSFYVSLLTEKNRDGGFAGIIKAAFVGIISNMSAIFGYTPYSSQVYIFRK